MCLPEVCILLFLQDGINNVIMKTKQIILSKEESDIIASKIANNITIDENGCHIWNGSKLKGGYGNLNSSIGIIQTHRFMYFYANGEIKDGYVVCHKCDNTSCCNPNHLFVGTQADNMRDCVKKNRNLKTIEQSRINGRKTIAENSKKRKYEDMVATAIKNARKKRTLKDDVVLKIKEDILSGYNCSQIARMNNTTSGIVHFIKTGQTYKDIV